MPPAPLSRLRLTCPPRMSPSVASRMMSSSGPCSPRPMAVSPSPKAMNWIPPTGTAPVISRSICRISLPPGCWTAPHARSSTVRRPPSGPMPPPCRMATGSGLLTTPPTRPTRLRLFRPAPSPRSPTPCRARPALPPWGPASWLDWLGAVLLPSTRGSRRPAPPTNACASTSSTIRAPGSPGMSLCRTTSPARARCSLNMMCWPCPGGLSPVLDGV